MVFNLGSQLFFVFLSFFRFGNFNSLFFLSAALFFFSIDKKNRFYASVGAQVENTHTKSSRRRCALARAVEGTIDAALFDDRGRDEGCWCPRPFLGQSRFRKVAKTPAQSQVFSFFSLFFLLPPRQGKVGISSVRFFSRQRRREHERAPPLKKLKITHAL